MLYKNKIRLIILSSLVFIFNNIAFAINKIEKLAEYDALELMMLADNGGSIVLFKDAPMAVTLKLNDSDNPSIETIKLNNNYTDMENTRFPLNNLISKSSDYDIDVEANNDTIYALLTNTNDSVRDKKNVLLKSTNGKEWSLYKTLPAEWELYDLEVNSNIISASCLNCEDQLKISYVISYDEGQSWHKYSLPENNSIPYFSGIAGNKLFVVTPVRNPDDRDEVTHKLQFSELKNKSPNWVSANISSLLSITRQHNGQDIELVFDDIEYIYSSSNVLLATVNYSNESLITEEEETVEIKSTWISKDGGQNWQIFKMKNLESEAIVQLDKKSNKYHIVTSRNIKMPESSLDESTDGLDIMGQLMKYFYDQKYSYYELTNDDLEKTIPFESVPKFELEHGIGFNLNYKYTHKASYVDTIFIHKGDDLTLEFYRLHS